MSPNNTAAFFEKEKKRKARNGCINNRRFSKGRLRNLDSKIKLFHTVIGFINREKYMRKD